MSDFLHKLQTELVGAKDRFGIAQKKFTTAQQESQAANQRLQAAQAEFQTAAQEMNSYQTLVNVWTKKAQEQATAPSPAMPDRLVIEVRSEAVETTSVSPSGSDANKTEKVRDLLRQNPSGMTPGDIWAKVESGMKNRAYLYSILKRLTDRGDAKEKRGKYYLIQKIEENQQTQMVQ
jgi:hypothetical protein